jgi:hypothetical protein
MNTANFAHSLCLAALTLGLLAASASPVTAANRALTSAEVRAQFAECGYDVGNSGSASNGPYIVVQDPAAAGVRDTDARVLMAIVYRDLESANGAHSRAHHDAEHRLGELMPFSNDNGPQLLPGYGGSVWRGNVALVESSSRTLNSMYSYDVEADETRTARPELQELGFVSISNRYAVDRDFVVCLEDAPALVASDGQAEPIYLQGLPW